MEFMNNRYNTFKVNDSIHVHMLMIQKINVTIEEMFKKSLSHYNALCK
jgi:hypothetical protein